MKNIEFEIIEVVRLIPFGRVTTYGAIAEFVGSKKSSRVVGYVLNRLSVRYNLPAHRVVNRNGILTGKNYFGTDNEMAELLISEGIKVIDDKVVDFEKYFWHPLKNLV